MNGSAKQRTADFEAFVSGRADVVTRKRAWQQIEQLSKLSPTRQALRRLGPRSVKIGIATVIAFLTLAAGTLAFIYDPPIAKDNFNDNWPNPEVWRFPRPRVSEREQHLWLQNRGCVATQKEFKEPISISFRWRWIDLAEDPAYAEVLAIALRSTGRMREPYPFEIDDGFVVTINSQEGSAYLSQAIPGVRGRRPLASSGTERVPLPANEWHDVRIVDDGATIALYLRGPVIGEKYWTKPVFQARVEAAFAGKRIAIYNREVVSGAPHLSQIDDFEVHRTPATPTEYE